MNDFKIGIKDRHPLIDFAYYGSKARRHAHPDVIIGEHSPYPLFREGDILDANAIFNLIKCTRCKEWQSVEKIDEHVADDVIHVTQEDKDRWNTEHEAAQSDWNETDTESVSYIKNKPSFATVAYTGNYSDLTNAPEVPNELADLQDDSTHRLVTDAEKTTWNNKQDPINDLETIRSGAASGATAYQKPSGGIPLTDMTSGVQTSLGKADTAYQKPQTGIPSTDMSSAVQISLGKADTALQQHQDISGKVDISSVGIANGVASLDNNCKIPSSQLPSYVDDVLEGYLNSLDGKFYEESTYTTEIPAEGGKIYTDLSTNKTYRWGGSAYVEISASVALGETQGTAYEGSKGKSVTDNFNTHAADTNIHVTAAKQSAWDAKSNFSGSYNDLTDKPTIPTVEQSDWNQSDSTAIDYIKNKPTIPTVPTNVSAFTNDAGYLTSVDYGTVGYTVHTDSVSGAVILDGRIPIHVLQATGNVTSVTLSNNPPAGHSCHVIFYPDNTGKDITITHDYTDRVCPDASNIQITAPANGYVEVDFLNVGNRVYVKA